MKTKVAFEKYDERHDCYPIAGIDRRAFVAIKIEHEKLLVWSITHVGTGCCMFRNDNYRIARKAIRKFWLEMNDDERFAFAVSNSRQEIKKVIRDRTKDLLRILRKQTQTHND